MSAWLLGCMAVSLLIEAVQDARARVSAFMASVHVQIGWLRLSGWSAEIGREHRSIPAAHVRHM